ncbi:MAG: XdhC family protein, partial [Anaerolineae bacterium]
MTTLFNTLTECLRRGELVALATMLTGPSAGRKLLIRPDGTSQGSLGSADLEAQVRAFAARPLQTQHPARRTFRVGGQAIDVFVDVYPPPPKLIIIGAVHIAMPLVTFGNELGFYTIVIDARATFAAPERFPHAGELIVRWPADALSELTLDEAT